MAAFAVIAAGGSGRRLGSPGPKFEVPLLGRPMVSYSLEAFQACPAIDAIVLVVPEERVRAWSPRDLAKAGITKAVATVAGGPTRQESVRNGLSAAGEGADTVAVHDAARPLVTPALVERVCAIGEWLAGQVPVLPLTDTVKRVEDGRVERTLDRSVLCSAQTPQAFDLAALVAAHTSALEEGFQGTDDASLVERAGGTVGTVRGNRENIKVTYPEDMLLAGTFLEERDRR